MSVKRYDHPERVVENPEWHECKEGHYVLATDYDSLTTSLARAEDENARLMEANDKLVRMVDACPQCGFCDEDTIAACAVKSFSDDRWMRDGEKREAAENEQDAMRKALELLCSETICECTLVTNKPCGHCRGMAALASSKVLP